MTVNTNYTLPSHPLSIITYTSLDALLTLIHISWAPFSLPVFNSSVHWPPHHANISIESFRTLDTMLLLGNFSWVLSCHLPSLGFFLCINHIFSWIKAKLHQEPLRQLSIHATDQVVSVHWHCLMANMPPALTKEMHLQVVSTHSFLPWNCFFSTTDTQLQHHCDFPKCKLSKC